MISMIKTVISVTFAPLMMALAVLACSGQLADMQIDSQPHFQCPTVVPSPNVPTPTPVTVQPSQPFYLNNWIEADGIHFRLADFRVVYEQSPVVVVTLSVSNRRESQYSFLPAAQFYVSSLADGQNGQWGVSAAAASKAGIPFRYEAHMLEPGQTQTVLLAAFIPGSTPDQFTYVLNPTRSNGSPAIIWVNETNPYC